jgi:plasmid stability protein
MKMAIDAGCPRRFASELEMPMAVLTVRNLPDEVHRALKERALGNGRSMQSEVRTILIDALWDSGHLKFGSYIAARAGELGGVDLNIERDRSPIEPATFE